MAELDISGNSIQLDCSVDSGICVEGVTKDLKKKIQEFKRILFILERDKEAMRLLRERLSRIAERKIVKKKKDGQSVCNVCFTQIDTDDSKTCVVCYSCAKNVCRGEKCSEWVPHDGEWRCQLCAAQRDSYGKASTWVKEQQAVKRASLTECSYPMRARSEIYIPLCDPNESAFLCNFESVSEVASPINPNQKQHIREYIEEVLAEMIGGSLENSTVEQISTNKDYQQVRNGHELQGVSNVRLRRLIESIIAETIRQPPFASAGLITTTSAIESSDIDHDHGGESLPLNGNANHCNGNGGQYFESKQYHDLLATAVLNRIVNTHGNGRLSESSPDLTSSSILDSNHNAINLNKTDESVSSSSSVEPRSESSLTDPIRSINKDEDGNFGSFYHDDVANDNIEADRESVLSDFISSHMVPLPHISAEPASEEDEDEEDYISVASSRDANWEDNWLFKKKKSNKTSSSSVGMLVPAPKEDIRALIGDKPTDEVSDLSEIGSDTDDSSLEMISASLEPLNDRLVNKHLIGGKNTKIVLDELVDRTSMISTSSLPDNEPPYTETKNEFVVSNDGLNESQSLKISVNICNKAISNEAINSNVTKAISAKVEKLTKEGQVTEDESIVPPPNDFTDDEKMRNLLAKFNEEQHNKTDSGDDNSSSMSPRSSISCALSDRISSESNCTDDSTTTVIDTFGSMEFRSNSDSSGEEFSPDDSTDRDSSATATTANNSILTTTNKATNQSHIYSPPPPLPLQPQPELRTESACSKLLQTRTSTGGNEEHVDDDPLKHLVPGSIAEREYKKWYNAVDMPNNPYSVEALRRRLSGGLDRTLDLPNISPCNEDNPLQLSESPAPEAETKGQERDYSRYSRDYYINDAKQASGTTKKSPTSPPQVSSPTSTASSIELDERVKHNSQTVETTPVKEMCHKLEKQCRIEADIYLATPVQVIEDIDVPQAFADKKPIQTVGRTITTSLTTEAVSRLSSDTSSILTNESLTPSEDSDTIRIYDLKKQETRLVKETTQTTTITVPKSPEKKVRPTELDIMPTLAPPIATVSAKCSTPTSFKFLQPKRKLINPSQVLSIDQDSTPLTPSTPDKTVIEAEVIHAMPSVKALAKAFLMTSSTSSSDNKWRKARAKTPMQFFKPTTPTATAAAAGTAAVANINRGIQKQPESVIPDTTSQGSEDATIASDLSSLETDPPSRIDGDTLDEDRVVLSGCLRNNIAFFENLKNK